MNARELPINEATAPVSAGRSDVEQRIERLEDVVAALCDADGLGERIAERVAQKLSHGEPRPAADDAPRSAPSPAPLKLQATPLPKERPLPTATIVEFTLPPEAPTGTPPVPSSNPSGFFWGFIPETSLARDLWWDMRTFVRMVRDPGYTATQAFRLVPLLILFFVFIWPRLAPHLVWLVPQASLGIFGLVADVLLIYVGYKIVQRELRRYDEFAAKYRR
jgi:hypothetical protein